MTPLALLFTLSAIGISETSYLIRKHIEGGKPICVIGEGCTVVLESKYNKTLGIFNEVWGLIFYFLFSILTAFLVLEIEPVSLWGDVIKVLIIAGVLFSLYFLFIQWKVIKAWCFWCVMSAVTVFLMALIILTSNIL